MQEAKSAPVYGALSTIGCISVRRVETTSKKEYRDLALLPYRSDQKKCRFGGVFRLAQLLH
jgi:hypothetical protein